MYPFYFGEAGYPFGADVYQDLIMVGDEHNISKMSGAWLTYQEQGFDIKGQGKEKFAHAISETPNALDHLRKRCFDSAGINFITKEG